MKKPINYANTLPYGFLLRGSAHTYRIERVLGQGSFGITYLATTKVVASGSLGSFETTINVAVKEFFMSEVNGRENSTVTSGSQGGLFDNYKRKFAREADNLSKLSHPHIVRVLELFEANNTFYYSMEYCESGSLDEEIERRGGLPEKDALNYIQQISDALTFMHSRQVLHLDLKPSNIMRRTPQEVILIDFGLSKHYDTSGNPESSTTIGGGTPGYSPIEQANYKSGDKLAVTLDVYALGATLYKMLTGKRPPVATDIFNEGFPREELEHKGVSGATISCIEKAMSSARRARYQSVEEFVSALSSHVSSASSEETNFVPPVSERTTLHAPKIEEADFQEPKPSKPQEKSEPILNNPEASKPTDKSKPQKQSRKINWFMLGGAALIALITIWTLFIMDVLRSQSAAENTPAVEVPVTPEETPAQSTASKSKPVKKASSQSTTSKPVAQASNSPSSTTAKEQGSNTARQTKIDSPAPYYVENASRNLNMKMIYVEGGTFQMGATSEQGSEAESNESPVHSVTVGSFYMAECEVTQAQWQKIMGTTIYQQRDKVNSSWSMCGVGDTYPMYYVNWEEANQFCQELSAMTGRRYRLPTEAEWEYAARGGNRKVGTKYSGGGVMDAVGWYDGNSGNATHPVKQKRANALGLYDMSGNVWEWCSDWYGDYSSLSQNNPTGPNSGQYRVLRGGSWYNSARGCRVSFRDNISPSSRDDSLGFRVVCLP